MLMQVLKGGKPLDPILVWWAGDQFFVIDGHHRLAAYDYAKWDQPIPVEVFEGSFDDARLRALQGNVKDKLPMSKTAKANAAWRLVKEGQMGKDETADLDLVSRSTVATMRRKLREMEAAGDEHATTLDWVNARRWPGGYVEPDADWRDKKIQQLSDYFLKHGIAKAFIDDPQIATEALALIDPDLPTNLISVAGPTVLKAALEQYEADADAFDPHED